MDQQTHADLEKYRQEYRDTDEATRWAMLRAQLNHVQQGVDAAVDAAADAKKAAVLAGDIAKGSIEQAAAELGTRIDNLAAEVATMAGEAKTISHGVNELRQNVGGVLELAESAVTVAGSAQRTLSKLATKNDEIARNSGAGSAGSGPPSAG